MIVMLGGGGTAGHVSPALATAEALQRLHPDVQVEFAGTRKGLEGTIIPGEGWPFHELMAAPFRRGLSVQALGANAKVPFVVLREARRLARLLRARRVRVVCVFGGYVSGPLAMAARMASIPLVLQEQNAVPGLANRLAARWAVRVAVSVPGIEQRFPHPARVVFTGNPVRASLRAERSGALREQAAEAFELDARRKTLLAFGGSLGARRINDALLEAAPAWMAEDVQIVHAAGRNDFARSTAAWEGVRSGMGIRVMCVPFIERMDLAYALADLVLARAGANTLAELTIAGLPSVLVPYPHAAADEQTANARALEERGAALLVPDAELTGQWITTHVVPLLRDADRLAAMAAAARQLGRPDAARAVAGLILGAAGIEQTSEAKE